MIWPFRKKSKPPTEEIQAAQAAQSRADTASAQVATRAEEVDVYYLRLRSRRLQNNFGDALVAAMERR